METVVRDDGSTYQNFYFDQETGARLGGGTKQGKSDTSCWSRGQAWGVTGVPFTYAYMKNNEILDKYYSIVVLKWAKPFLVNSASPLAAPAK